MGNHIILVKSVSLIFDTKSGKFHISKSAYTITCYWFMVGILPPSNTGVEYVYMEIGIPEPRIR